jgi:hypothetical protein
MDDERIGAVAMRIAVASVAMISFLIGFVAGVVLCIAS